MWEMINEIGKWMGVGLLLALSVFFFIVGFWILLTLLAEAVREEVNDLRDLQKERKALKAENGWHDCKEFDCDSPAPGELCVLRIRYREYKGEPWEERYVTSEWTGCEWTQDSMNFLRYQEESEITHWKRI